MNKKSWTAVAGLCLGLTVVALVLMAADLSAYPAVRDLVSWMLGIGVIGLMLGIIGKGFAKE